MNQKSNTVKLIEAVGFKTISQKALLKKLRIKLPTLKKRISKFNRENSSYSIENKDGKYRLVKRISQDVSISKPRTDKQTERAIVEVAKTEPVQGLFESIPEEWKLRKMLDDIDHNRDSLPLEERLVIVLREYVKIKKQVKDVLRQIDNSLTL